MNINVIESLFKDRFDFFETLIKRNANKNIKLFDFLGYTAYGSYSTILDPIDMYDRDVDDVKNISVQIYPNGNSFYLGNGKTIKEALKVSIEHLISGIVNDAEPLIDYDGCCIYETKLGKILTLYNRKETTITIFDENIKTAGLYTGILFNDGIKSVSSIDGLYSFHGVIRTYIYDVIGNFLDTKNLKTMEANNDSFPRSMLLAKKHGRGLEL